MATRSLTHPCSRLRKASKEWWNIWKAQVDFRRYADRALLSSPLRARLLGILKALSIFIGALNGKAPSPMATRAWSPISSPNASWIKDKAPIGTYGNHV